MRVIAGMRRGLVLDGPDDQATRPTSDRARQVMFDVLAHAGWAAAHPMQDAKVLDGFAGTGAFGIEALSRGAAHVTFMDHHSPAHRTLIKNIRRARFADHSMVLKCDVTAPPRATGQMDIAFLDPPYGQNLLPLSIKALMRTGWIGPDTLIITESEKNLDPINSEPPLDLRKIGVARISFWRGAQWEGI
ncbi:RsmD family RNA methyltransferase [Candidatus Kirkpatrickella diaphorinae]|uniref:RsmD family RNA methyltransferase n=1 Tax=Candidatus Kirkpatrickella diaphorinae TaxID=2984322 RepID=A0ABY6GIH0_9PROT|nr:RsmD family RNA methyltransferase [Candidatus Kirkpatrickella diaphorinae]UYH51318.1 RsmD family RNA methyltransferase [Candidatus Kirkpatrickella diaphorinae]